MSAIETQAEARPIASLKPPATLPPDRLYRLSVEQYQRMAREGILTKNDRIELIEGLLVKKMTRNERHLSTTWLIQKTLEQTTPEGYFIGKEDPVLLARSEPEPDVMVLRGVLSDYFQRKPRAADAVLVVEVADSSYAEDCDKISLYAEANIPYYWIANIPAHRIEAYSDPTGPDPNPSYRRRDDYGYDDEIPLVIDGREILRIPVRDLLPPEAV